MFKLGLLGMIVCLAISVVIDAFLFPYALNTWLVFFGKAPTIVWWHGAIAGLIPFFGQLIIPGAFATWILMLFLV